MYTKYSKKEKNEKKKKIEANEHEGFAFPI